jgi:hypothetical protein
LAAAEESARVAAATIKEKEAASAAAAATAAAAAAVQEKETSAAAAAAAATEAVEKKAAEHRARQHEDAKKAGLNHPTLMKRHNHNLNIAAAGSRDSMHEEAPPHRHAPFIKGTVMVFSLAALVSGRGLHSSTFQLNLSRFCH